MPSVQIYPHPIFNENDLNPRPSPRNNTTTSTNNNNNNVSPTVNNNTIQEETKIDIDDDNLPLAVTINDAGILGILNGRMSCSHPYDSVHPVQHFRVLTSVLYMFWGLSAVKYFFSKQRHYPQCTFAVNMTFVFVNKLTRFWVN